VARQRDLFERRATCDERLASKRQNIGLFCKALLQKRAACDERLASKRASKRRFVGSLKKYVSFAKEPYKRDDILATCDERFASKRSF